MQQRSRCGDLKSESDQNKATWIKNIRAPLLNSLVKHILIFWIATTFLVWDNAKRCDYLAHELSISLLKKNQYFNIYLLVQFKNKVNQIAVIILIY